jgi:TonB family protein
LLASFDPVLPESPQLPDYQPRYAELELGEKADLANDVLHLGVGATASQRPDAARHDVYEEVAVDRRASPAPTNPKPRYPFRMRARSIEANFVVHFVVDTTGVVDTATVELPTSVEPDFTTAVAEVLGRWHFVPAELSGWRVRQRMLQPFFFQLAEQYSSISRL